METNELTSSLLEINPEDSVAINIFQKNSVGKIIKILMLEYSDQDTELIKQELEKANIEFIERVSSKKAYVRELFEFKPDILLSDGAVRFLHWNP